MVSTVQRLRQEARKRRSAVTSKIARIRRNTGVEIKDTEFDPRKPPKAVDRMGQPQLRRYLNELNAFTARGNQFEPGVDNIPIPRSAWRDYKQAEADYNRIGERHLEALKKNFRPADGVELKAPGYGLHPQADASLGQVPYQEFDREPTQIKSYEALKQLTKDLKAKSDPKYMRQVMRDVREQMNAMFDMVGQTGSNLAERANKLSDFQLDSVWHYTKMARQVSLLYEIMKLQARDGTADAKEGQFASVLEDSEDELDTILRVAESQPKKPAQEGNKKSSR